jgi:prevent-host-death family protein
MRRRPTEARRVTEERGTIVAMTTESLRTVKDRLSEFVDRVQREHDRVMITKNGTPAAVLISATDLDELEETIAVLSDRKAVRELREAGRAVAEGDVVRGVEAVRKLRAR